MPPVTTEVAPDSQTASVLRERRFKLSRACDRCRRRRIKCDEGHPCQACITANSACTFEEPGKRSHPHKSKRTTTLEDRMHHLETLIQAIPPAVFAAGTAAVNPKQPPEHPSPTLAFPFPAFPSAIPPPSRHPFPIINPSTHFTTNAFSTASSATPNVEVLAEDTTRMSLTASYLYFDDEGYTRWQGETSGLPLLDLLVERHTVPEATNSEPSPKSDSGKTSETQWFPNRTPRRTNIKPQTIWSMITAAIAPELLDSLVQCYLSTSYYILPFLHIPTFLADYGNPQKWGEPGFATFIVAICCLASRHMDDPRVRADPNDSISAGTHWFDLLGKLRTLPTADRPTLYTIQANLIAGVYAVGLGRLSKGAALLSEAITVSVDAGLHRSADTYDLFDPIEDEVRKRTFWCVYIWDKQLSAHFGRPPMIRLRDCDVAEPAPVDDEYVTVDGVLSPPPGTECRMAAFVHSIRIFVVLESVLSVPPSRHGSSPFMQKAASLLAKRGSGSKDLREEEALLDEIHRGVPIAWMQTSETLGSDDAIRLTQAERLYCAEHFVRLLIYRHRFSETVAHAVDDGIEHVPEESEREAMISAHSSALEIARAHMHIARKGLMTYYGVHVIHQLTQAGRTLVAVLLNCKSEPLQHLIPSGLDALRTCIGLLRRFSGDLMEEFCRLTQIPLEPSQSPESDHKRPPWVRPVRKKAPSVARSSPEAFSPTDFQSQSSAGSEPRSQPQPQPQPKFEFDGMGMDMGIGEMGYMNMSPEVMALFDGGNVDLNGILGFGTESSYGEPSGVHGLGAKMNGIVTSPS
ncbi:fungal-specific transcription factor domain-containing protein [Mucidula mucida]|nr:fungal-specific transcription factor domain-containing protein [Mucidula mucida]